MKLTKESQQCFNDMFSKGMSSETSYTNPKKDEINVFKSGWIEFTAKACLVGFTAGCVAMLYDKGVNDDVATLVGACSSIFLTIAGPGLLIKKIKKSSGRYRKCSCGSVHFNTELKKEYFVNTTPRTKSGKKDRRYAETGYHAALIKFNCEGCGGYHTQEFKV